MTVSDVGLNILTSKDVHSIAVVRNVSPNHASSASSVVSPRTGAERLGCVAGAVRLLGGGGGLLGVNAQHAYEELNFLKLRVLMLNQENTALGKPTLGC